jgi:hypothetical protein
MTDAIERLTHRFNAAARKYVQASENLTDFVLYSRLKGTCVSVGIAGADIALYPLLKAAAGGG